MKKIFYRSSRLLMIAFALLSLSHPETAFAESRYEGTEDDLYMHIMYDVFDPKSNCPKFADDMTPEINFPATGDINRFYGIGWMMNTLIDHYTSKMNTNESHDFGLSCNTSFFSRFIITGYATGKEKYIESIDINWSDETPNGGALRLLGRLDNGFIYTQTPSNIANRVDLDVVLRPEEAINGVTHYTFKTPVRYIAFFHEFADDTPVGLTEDYLARFSSFTIHFVKDEPKVDPEEKSISFGNGISSNLDVKWDKNGNGQLAVSVKDYLGNDIEDLSDLNAKFFVQPFEGASWNKKPDLNGSKPDYMSETQWLVFQTMEKHNMVYDGYWDSTDKIECKLDATSKSLKINVPCSGLYKLTVESDDPSITASEATLNIWPDLSVSYDLSATGLDEYLGVISLNGIPHSDDNGNYFYYPFENQNIDSGAYKKEAVEIHVPGLYDAHLYYKLDLVSNETGNGKVARKVASDVDGLEGYTLYKGPESINFEDMNSYTNARLQLKAVKNGAVTPSDENGESVNTYEVQLDRNTSTAVLSIGQPAFEGNAVYYNLNGMPVSKDNLSPGIYIRKTEKGAEKFIQR